jgi:hypothetical protein
VFFKLHLKFESRLDFIKHKTKLFITNICVETIFTLVIFKSTIKKALMAHIPIKIIFFINKKLVLIKINLKNEWNNYFQFPSFICDGHRQSIVKQRDDKECVLCGKKKAKKVKSPQSIMFSVTYRFVTIQF